MADDNIYLRSVASTKNVGHSVAKVIDYMVLKRNARLEDIHVVGHSLGILMILDSFKLMISFNSQVHTRQDLLECIQKVVVATKK